VPQLPASHFLYMVAYALLVSIVFAMLVKDERREQAKTAGMMVAGFIVAALAAGWLMYPFPL
jgi:cytochrome bd-type quinol oxidase subunit 2